MGRSKSIITPTPSILQAMHIFPRPPEFDIAVGAVESCPFVSGREKLLLRRDIVLRDHAFLGARVEDAAQ